METKFYVEMYGKKTDTFECSSYSEAVDSVYEKLLSPQYSAGSILDDAYQMMKFIEREE